VVEFYRTENGLERFGWGIVGEVPLLTLIGFLTRVQSDLFFKSPDKCDQSALVVAWDAENKVFDYCVNQHIPVDPLVGMLELVKMTLVKSQLENNKQQHSGVGLFGADGRPLFNRR